MKKIIEKDDYVLLDSYCNDLIVGTRIHKVTKISKSRVYITEMESALDKTGDKPEWYYTGEVEDYGERYVQMKTITAVFDDFEKAKIAVEKINTKWENYKKEGKLMQAACWEIVRMFGKRE